MKQIIYILCFCCMLSSCGLPYCKKHQFTQEDLEWISAYNENDTILFRSENKTDTLIIESKEVYNPKNTFIFDCSGCNWILGDNEFYAIASIDFSLIHDSVKYNGGFTIRKIEKYEPAKINLYMGGLYSIDYLEINNHTVTLDRNTNAELGKHQLIMNLKEISYSKHEGITTYKMLDGSIYTFDTILTR